MAEKEKVGIYGFKYMVYGATVVLFIAINTGCAPTHKTTTIETVEQHHTSGAVGNVTHASDKTADATTTLTTNKSKPEHRGILGGIVQVVGSIIAFPFVVIGGLFKMIF